MLAAFLADCQRTHRSKQPSPRLVMRVIKETQGLKALFGYRLGRRLLQLRAQGRKPLLRLFGWPLYWLVSGYARKALGIDLQLSADIGPGLYIGHFGNIVVRNCTLGSHCSIAQSVHIEPTGDDATGPVIGNRVWIGGHTDIVGSWRIGDRSTIGAGALVTRDIPEGALFIGRPGRVVMSDYDNSDIL
jgi:serine O-acetyltransferase